MTNPYNCRNRTGRFAWWRYLLDVVRMGKHMCYCRVCGKGFGCADPTDDLCPDHRN